MTVFLCLSSYHVTCKEGKREEGICDAVNSSDTTCTADSIITTTQKKEVCFPDGKCFESKEEAESYYTNKHYKNKSFKMAIRKPTSFGSTQEVVLDNNQQYFTKTLEVLSKSHDYMIQISQDDTAVTFRRECKLRNELCIFWAAIGTCTECK